MCRPVFCWQNWILQLLTIQMPQLCREVISSSRMMSALKSSWIIFSASQFNRIDVTTIFLRLDSTLRVCKPFFSILDRLLYSNTYEQSSSLVFLSSSHLLSAYYILWPKGCKSVFDSNNVEETHALFGSWFVNL